MGTNLLYTWRRCWLPGFPSVLTVPLCALGTGLLHRLLILPSRANVIFLVLGARVQTSYTRGGDGDCQTFLRCSSIFFPLDTSEGYMWLPPSPFLRILSFLMLGTFSLDRLTLNVRLPFPFCLSFVPSHFDKKWRRQQEHEMKKRGKRISSCFFSRRREQKFYPTISDPRSLYDIVLVCLLRWTKKKQYKRYRFIEQLKDTCWLLGFPFLLNPSFPHFLRSATKHQTSAHGVRVCPAMLGS